MATNEGEFTTAVALALRTEALTLADLYSVHSDRCHLTTRVRPVRPLLYGERLLGHCFSKGIGDESRMSLTWAVFVSFDIVLIAVRSFVSSPQVQTLSLQLCDPEMMQQFSAIMSEILANDIAMRAGALAKPKWNTRLKIQHALPSFLDSLLFLLGEE